MKRALLAGLLILGMAAAGHAQDEGGWFGPVPRAQSHGISMNGIKLGYHLKAMKANLPAGCTCKVHNEGAGQYLATFKDAAAGVETACTCDQHGIVLEIDSRQKSAIEKDGKTLFHQGDPAVSGLVLFPGDKMPEYGHLTLADQHGTLLVATEGEQIGTLAIHH